MPLLQTLATMFAAIIIGDGPDNGNGFALASNCMILAGVDLLFSMSTTIKLY